jgi:hypothetical protein
LFHPKRAHLENGSLLFAGGLSDIYKEIFMRKYLCNAEEIPYLIHWGFQSPAGTVEQ